MAIDETVRNICNTETKNVLWSKGERRMKYEKPEMEVVEWDEKVITGNITITSNEDDVFDMGEL